MKKYSGLIIVSMLFSQSIFASGDYKASRQQKKERCCYRFGCETEYGTVTERCSRCMALVLFSFIGTIAYKAATSKAEYEHQLEINHKFNRDYTQQISGCFEGNGKDFDALPVSNQLKAFQKCRSLHLTLTGQKFSPLQCPNQRHKNGKHPKNTKFSKRHR